jgi:tRNA A37 methylthiotransferase MiaB
MGAQWVDRREIERRSEILRAVSRGKHRQFLEQQVGKFEEVLFENPGNRVLRDLRNIMLKFW